jgi:hypothetical protein
VHENCTARGAEPDMGIAWIWNWGETILEQPARSKRANDRMKNKRQLCFIETPKGSVSTFIFFCKGCFIRT